MKVKFTDKFNDAWSRYDTLQASIHKDDWGLIILDPVTETPIDNEDDLILIYNWLEDAKDFNSLEMGKVYEI